MKLGDTKCRVDALLSHFSQHVFFASLKFNRSHCFVVVAKRAAVFSFAPLFQHGIESEFSKT
jgi:hypothetical protein